MNSISVEKNCHKHGLWENLAVGFVALSASGYGDVAGLHWSKLLKEDSIYV